MSTGMLGFRTLFAKELRRFAKVGFQTLAAPVISSLLYLMIFSHVLQDKVTVFAGVPYTRFLVPGLVMMAVLQNSFANAASSMVQSKITGNVVFVLLPPLSPGELFAGYVLAAMVRGLVVGLGVWVVTWTFAAPHLAAPAWALGFAVLCSAILGTMGLIAGIWAEKFDQMAAFQNFFIMPMTFLSGVFYSVDSLSGFWQAVSHLNPFFYMVDGFRYGFFGMSDVAPWTSLAVVAAALVGLVSVALTLLASGFRLRH
ncbi:MAG: ABC transporter permease [Burkholderiaceae bacterium]